MALKITPIESLRKGTIKRLELLAEVEKAKADPASKPTFFQCRNCGKNTPITEVGRRRGSGQADCKACTARVKAIKAGTYRYGSSTLEATQRTNNRRAKKKYISGKNLPKWMFS